MTLATVVQESPWRHVGRVFHGGPSNLSDDSIGGTGTLIAVEGGGAFVLTAAHVVLNSSGTPHSNIGFALAQSGPNCVPYNVDSASALWVPREYLEPLPATVSPNDESRYYKAFDYAVIGIAKPTSPLNVPDAHPINLGIVNQQTKFLNLAPFATGYACGRDRTTISGECRLPLWMYTTTSETAMIIDLVDFSAGGLLASTVEGVARMSGGPVWVSVLGHPLQIGVSVGSSCDPAENSTAENWAAALTPDLHARINALVSEGEHPDMRKFALNVGDCPDPPAGAVACGFGSGWGVTAECGFFD